jgi:hypothetical protein
MAKVVLVVGCSHSTFLYTPPETWNKIRGQRALSPSVPHDSEEANQEKYRRCMAAFSILKEKIELAQPDVLLIFGDDQLEQFQFSCMPGFGIYLGDKVQGRGRPLKHLPKNSGLSAADFWRRTNGHPDLAKELASRLVKKGFDICFSMKLPDDARGIGHAFMYPPYYLTPAYNVPILPVFINCYFPPQPTGKRCHELGTAVRQVIEECPIDLKVAVVGSGGLWHMPDVPGAYLDEQFDRTILQCVADGSGRRMGEYFDSFEWPARQASAETAKKLLEVTGMKGGVGSGVGETRNWIAAASVAEGSRGTVVDYVPVYASPCGMGFAFWELI